MLDQQRKRTCRGWLRLVASVADGAVEEVHVGTQHAIPVAVLARLRRPAPIGPGHGIAVCIHMWEAAGVPILASALLLKLEAFRHGDYKKWEEEKGLPVPTKRITP